MKTTSLMEHEISESENKTDPGIIKRIKKWKRKKKQQIKQRQQEQQQKSKTKKKSLKVSDYIKNNKVSSESFNFKNSA